MCKKLQSIPEPDGSGTLFDNTLMIWTRDFGDADGHNSESMKFVLAQGNGGYLKRSPNGRYLGRLGQQAQERILLNLAEAMGVTDFDRLRRHQRRLQAEQDAARASCARSSPRSPRPTGRGEATRG